VIRIPTEPSLEYYPDWMEVAALVHAIGDRPNIGLASDAQGRICTLPSPEYLPAATGVVIMEWAKTTLVVSEAIFAVRDAFCPCGEPALVDIHEIYKRTHGGNAPSRLLAAQGLARTLRRRCRCGQRLDYKNVRSAVPAPFAHVAVLGEADEEALERVSGFPWRVTGEAARSFGR
jgi:hypothetical protein